MPSGMRNATPGSSSLGRNVNAPGAGGSHGAVVVQGRSNVVKKKEDKDRERQKALKRPSSEEVLDEEEREKKKAKFVEDFGDDDATSAKDNKEKKRKRKKKRKKTISVVVSVSSDTSQQDVMGLSLLPSSETLVNGSHGRATSRHFVAEVARVNGVKVENGADDEAPTYSSSDKGKGKAKPDSPRSLAHDNRSGITPGSGTRSTTLEGPDQSSEVARLKEQLAEQGKLLEKHQSYLNQQQQALTCQICLELLYRPYALIPCGHVTCYGCLVRWFTSDLNPEEPIRGEEQQANENNHPNGNDLNVLLNSATARRGTFVRRRKTCPVCRGVVPDRPVEMWDIKQMVAALVKSHLVDLPVPPGEVGEGSSSHGDNTPNDPWRNVFKAGRGHHRHGGPPPPGQADDEDERVRFGLYDHEDGGVYRCIECHHELWGGMCTGCERIYVGHEADEDDSDEEDEFLYDDDDDLGALEWAGYMYFQQELRRRLDEEDDDDEEAGEEAEEVDMEYLREAERHLDVEDATWSMRGDEDVDAIESSDGFVDEEERMRSVGLGGVGDVEGYLSEGVDSEEEAGNDPGRWICERSLGARNHLEEEEEGTSGLDEGSDAGIVGWGGDISGGDTDEEIRRSPAPSLRRSTRRTLAAQPFVESDASSGDESVYHSPPQQRPSRRRWARVVGSDSEDEDDLGEDGPPVEDDGDELTWVEYFQMRTANGR